MIQKVKKAPFNKCIKCIYTRAIINLQHYTRAIYKSSSKENIRTTYLLHALGKEAKQAVQVVGTSILFYSGAKKMLEKSTSNFKTNIL